MSQDYTVYNPDADYAAFKKAYKLWTDLIVGNKAYSNGGTTLDKISSQATFAAGGAAMMPNAHWLYNEMKDTNIEFEMAFMNTPRAPEALDDTDYNYLVGFGDAMAVPACAVNLDLAKEFLKFCAKEENCAKFTKMTNGAFFAYDYSGISLEDESDPVKIDAKAVEYVHSIKAKLDNSTCYNVTSKAQIAYMTTNKVGNWPNNEFYYTKAYDTAGFSDTTIDNWFKSIYTLVKTNWPNWERSAGLKN